MSQPQTVIVNWRGIDEASYFTGYYENWDNELSDTGYGIGIVDIASKAILDDGYMMVSGFSRTMPLPKI